MTNPGYQKQLIDQSKAIFKAADANKDGCLTKAEFMDFAAKDRENNARKGLPVDTDKHDDLAFKCFDEYNPGNHGVS